MNVSEITARLYALNDALTGKTGKPGTYNGLYLTVRDDHCEIMLHTEYEANGGWSHGTAKGDTPSAALASADAIVAALPSLVAARNGRHMARIADCIDKAKADGIADEYVTPLRMTVAAMTENLLTVAK